MSGENAFVKEYYTGRKDQFDLDYLIFREAAKSAASKEELIGVMNEKYQFVISRLAERRAKTLKEDLGLL